MNKLENINDFQYQNPRILIVSLKSDNSVNIAPPTGLYLLQGYLKKHGLGCTIADRDLEGFETHLDQIYKGYYQIIGFSVSSVHIIDDLELIWELKTSLKQKNINSIFIGGGQEATNNSRQWLDSGLDLIFKGFCERELVKFCKKLTIADFADKVPSLEEATEGVQGIVYKKDKSYIDVMAPIFSVKQLKELCYDTVMEAEFPYKQYWNMLDEQSADINLGASEFFIENVRVYTTSHCPRRCGFCSSQSFLPYTHGKNLPIVMLNAKQVADIVIMYATRYGAKSILFSDDDFPVGNRQGLERLIEFCHLMIEEKRKKRITGSMRFSCQSRIFNFLISKKGKKVINWDLIKLMRKAGFMSIGMGVETFTDRILKGPSINKIGVTVQDCHNVINALLEVGLVPQTNLILGIPEYTVDELVDTLEVAFAYIRRGIDVATTIKMMSMAGSPMQISGELETIYRYWHNPYTGDTLKIADYFQPNDKIIREGFLNFSSIAEKEIEDIRWKHGWEDKILHKRVISICNLIGVARGINRDDVANRFRLALEEIMDASEGNATL
jgi:radical SAM superfamily enzyme YgiQ (UPF0313 family)